MVFAFDLETDPEPPFVDALGTEILEFAVGYDIDADIVVVMSVMLVPFDDAHDLRFGIREKSLAQEWKVSAPDYGVEAVKRYIPRQHRLPVTEKLLEAIKTLVGKVAPRSVTMETYYAGLPPKAIKKYDRVSDCLRDCNYRIADRFRDATTRKDYWFFTRPD